MDTLLKQRIAEILSTGWRQSLLAQAVNKSPAAVSKWVSGRVASISLSDARKIASLTGYSAEWIVMGIGPKFAVDGPKPAPGKARRGKNYVAENARISAPVESDINWQSVQQFLAQQDQSLAEYLHVYQNGGAEMRSALLAMAKIFSLANGPQLSQLLQALWQNAGTILFAPHLTRAHLSAQELSLLATYHAANDKIRCNLLNLIFGLGHSCTATSAPARPENELTLQEMQMVSAVREKSEREQAVFFGLIEKLAKKIGVDEGGNNEASA